MSLTYKNMGFELWKQYQSWCVDVNQTFVHHIILKCFNMKDQVVELLKRNDFIVSFSKRNASKVSSNICNFY
jgi:hypothetical protein